MATSLADMALLDTWLKTDLDDLIAFRRDLHAHPELSGQEERTARRVADALVAAGLEVSEGIGGYGVVGTIRGARGDGPSVAFRADMDALPIREAACDGHASTVAGVMHACGHDGHTAILLGAARYLAKNRDFAGTLHLIFQPAEEILTGAKAMIDDGLFDRFPCDAIYGLHNAPELPLGHIATRPGSMFAAADSWQATFRGRGGHGGAEPHLSQDVTHAQAHFVLALQGMIGRNVPPAEPAVCSIGHIAAGRAGTPNVVPSLLVIQGTLRGLTADVRVLLHRRMHELAEATALAWGCKVELEITPNVGPVINHSDHVEHCAAAARAAGASGVDASMPPVMASEDFGIMLEHKPGAMVALGSGWPAGELRPLHTPIYDFNDHSISLGVRYWIALAERLLVETRSSTSRHKAGDMQC